MTRMDKLCGSGLHDISDPAAVYMHKGKRRCRACHRARIKAAYKPKPKVKEMSAAEADAFLEREDAKRMRMPWERNDG